MHYKLAIAHRVCPALSQTAVGFNTKLDLVRATTLSLANALSRVTGKTKLTVILDGCPPAYESLFQESFRTSEAVDLEIIQTSSVGNQVTFGKQIEVLLASPDTDFVYFSEDDYLYHPDAFTAMIDFLHRPGVDLVTPLDHPDRYNHQLTKPHDSEIRVSAFCYWRTVGTSCLTFMTSRNVFLQTHKTLESYAQGAMDGTMWLGMTKEEVFNPVVLLRAVAFFLLRIQASFGLFMPLCAWKHHGVRLLVLPRFRLWGALPTLAVHLSDRSLPPFAEKIMSFDSDEEREKFRTTVSHYLDLP